jgi:DNA-binding CsgD family transcriptional regulator
MGAVTQGRVTRLRRRGHTIRRRPGEDAKTRERAARALDLRITGATYRQIAKALNTNEKTAYYDVQDELGRLDAVTRHKAERLRDLELRRLDRCTAALDPRLADGDPRAVMASVRVMERRAKLLGLDAPLQVTGADGAPVSVTIVHQELKDTA